MFICKGKEKEQHPPHQRQHWYERRGVDDENISDSTSFLPYAMDMASIHSHPELSMEEQRRRQQNLRGLPCRFQLQSNQPAMERNLPYSSLPTDIKNNDSGQTQEIQPRFIWVMAALMMVMLSATLIIRFRRQRQTEEESHQSSQSQQHRNEKNKRELPLVCTDVSCDAVESIGDFGHPSEGLMPILKQELSSELQPSANLFITMKTCEQWSTTATSIAASDGSLYPNSTSLEHPEQSRKYHQFQQDSATRTSTHLELKKERKNDDKKDDEVLQDLTSSVVTVSHFHTIGNKHDKDKDNEDLQDIAGNVSEDYLVSFMEPKRGEDKDNEDFQDITGDVNNHCSNVAHPRDEAMNGELLCISDNFDKDTQLNTTECKHEEATNDGEVRDTNEHFGNDSQLHIMEHKCYEAMNDGDLHDRTSSFDIDAQFKTSEHDRDEATDDRGLRGIIINADHGYKCGSTENVHDEEKNDGDVLDKSNHVDNDSQCRTIELKLEVEMDYEDLQGMNGIGGNNRTVMSMTSREQSEMMDQPCAAGFPSIVTCEDICKQTTFPAAMYFTEASPQCNESITGKVEENIISSHGPRVHLPARSATGESKTISVSLLVKDEVFDKSSILPDENVTSLFAPQETFKKACEEVTLFCGTQETSSRLDADIVDRGACIIMLNNLAIYQELDRQEGENQSQQIVDLLSGMVTGDNHGATQGNRERKAEAVLSLGDLPLPFRWPTHTTRVEYTPSRFTIIPGSPH